MFPSRLSAPAALLLAAGVWIAPEDALANDPAQDEPAPTLPADKDGYCQRTEFIGWSADGSRAAYSVSYCRQPPVDAAYDTLFVTARNGAVKQWFTGAQAGATMAVETRARLLFGEFFRKAGAKAPKGALSAQVRLEGEYLLVSFASADENVKAPRPLSQALQLPYPEWPDLQPPKPGAVYWSPDGQALAITLEGVKKTPAGGRLPVRSIYFAELGKREEKKESSAAPAPEAR